MASFELIYEEDEDVLEVTFASFDEHFARAIPLNENIIVHTDTAVAVAWGITFYDYAKLLQVSETHLDGLHAFEEVDRQRLFRVIVMPPLCYFLQLLEPAELRALVKAPRLDDLLHI
jgi:hypothetical protein